MLQEVWWHYLLVYMLAVLYVYFCFQKMSSTVFYLLFFQISLYIYKNFRSFWCNDIKNRFLKYKTKKYYFYIFSCKKYFKVLIASLTCPLHFGYTKCSGRGWVVCLYCLNLHERIVYSGFPVQVMQKTYYYWNN
jgi:hypothetical protein